jgi:hypothetical protein
MDFHVGHVITYRSERIKEVAVQTVDLEMDALLTLLRELHLGTDIEQHYRDADNTSELTQDEIKSLPERVRYHLTDMKRELASRRSENHRLKSQIRKTNWGRTR